MPRNVPRRWVLGITTDARGHVLQGAAVLAAGQGWDLLGQQSCFAQQPLKTPLPPCGDVAVPPSLAVVTQVTEAAIHLVGDLLAHIGPDREDALIVTVHDVGAWADDRYLGRTYQSWCDDAWLSAATGLTVLDQFPATDLALGGAGGPLLLAPLWVLLRDRLSAPGQRIRAWLDFRAGQMDLWLIPGHLPGRAPELALLQLAPNGLDNTLGGTSDEASWSWNVAERWLPTPDRGRPWDLPAPPTSRRVAERVLYAMHHEVPSAWPLRELLVSVRGPQAQLQGQLIDQLREQDDQLEVTSLLEVTGWQPDQLQAAATALLGLVAVDRVALNPNSQPVVGAPRLMGRFTPGSGAKWQLLLAEMADPCRTVMQLRHAI